MGIITVWGIKRSTISVGAQCGVFSVWHSYSGGTIYVELLFSGALSVWHCMDK